MRQSSHQGLHARAHDHEIRGQVVECLESILRKSELAEECGEWRVGRDGSRVVRHDLAWAWNGGGKRGVAYGLYLGSPTCSMRIGPVASGLCMLSVKSSNRPSHAASEKPFRFPKSGPPDTSDIACRSSAPA